MGSEINLHGEIRSHPLSPPAGSGFCHCLYCGSTWGSQTRTPLCEAVKGNKGMTLAPSTHSHGESDTSRSAQREWDEGVHRDAEPLCCGLIIWVSGLNVQ